MTPAKPRDILGAIASADPVAGTTALCMLRNLAAHQLWAGAARDLDTYLRPEVDTFPWIDAEIVNWPEPE